MDYVVFGIGFGATILVLGLLVRDIGPRLRFRAPAEPDGVFHAEELVAKVSWSRFCSALGTVLAIGGALFVLVTVVSMLLMLSDRTGGRVMLGALALLVVVIAYWTWAFFDRFGSYGILPEREQAPEEEARPEPVVTVAPPVDAREERPGADEGPVEDDETADEETAADPEPDAGEPEREPAIQDEDAVSPDEPAASRGTEPEPAVEDTDARLETPEERLANMETPIDHGSAEGDLDIAAAGRRRPGPRTNLPGNQRRYRPTAKGASEPGESESETPGPVDPKDTTGDEDHSS